MSALRVAGLLLWGTAAAVQAQERVEDSSAEVGAASPCDDRRTARGMPEGPISLGYADADLGVGRRVCARTEVSLGARAGAVIDTPDFYGAIGVTGLLSGSWALTEKVELFATLEAVRYQWVTNAVIVASELTLGQLTAGATYRTFTTGRWGGAVSARLLLPTGMASPGVRTLGAELGHGFLYRSEASRLDLHAYAGLDFTAALSAASALPRLGGVLLVGAQYNPWQRVGFALELSGRYGWTSSLAPSLAVRVGLGRGFGGELAISRPLLGTDRHTALVGLRLGYRL